ncbi:MAG: hypothetical protein RR397_08390, partial [Odoribacter sp.]
DTYGMICLSLRFSVNLSPHPIFMTKDMVIIEKNIIFDFIIQPFILFRFILKFEIPLFKELI